MRILDGSKADEVVHGFISDYEWWIAVGIVLAMDGVIEGEFKGVHGRVARIAGQQRVVVELFDGCLVATAYVPKEAMRIYTQL